MEPVKYIALDSEFDSYVDKDGKQMSVFGQLSRVNVLVGSNNSGKSKFMRSLARIAQYSVRSVDIPDEARESLAREAARIKGLMNNMDLNELNDAQKGGLSEDLLNPLIEMSQFHTYGVDTFATIRESAGSMLSPPSVDFGNYTVLNRESKQIAKLFRHYEGLLPNFSQVSSPKKVYIPTLRGLRHLSMRDDEKFDFYQARTAVDYFSDEKRRPEIFTGLSLYADLTNQLLGDLRQRQTIEKYERFLSDAFFSGKAVTLTPHRTRNVVVVKIGEEEERAIHDLGDGIQAVIILTYLAAVRQEPTWFFIEEAETHLHPGLQRKLLDFFFDKDRDKHTFFLTTHSNHLLDMTFDYKAMTVFNFVKRLPDGENDSKNASFVIEQLDGVDSSSLELLEVQNSSVFLVNATIWVEGITDRLYFRTMLDLYQRTFPPEKTRYAEDVHFSFVEYGGANIAHWKFSETKDVKDSEARINVERLCSRAYVILDDDGGEKQRRKKELTEAIKDRVEVLPCREVENLLPYSIIKAIVESYEKQSVSVPDFGYDMYKGEYLGNFIEKKMLLNGSKRRYAEASGTITDKLNFCKKATEHLVDWTMLPDSTQEVIVHIYNHIASRNR